MLAAALIAVVAAAMLWRSQSMSLMNSNLRLENDSEVVVQMDREAMMADVPVVTNDLRRPVYTIYGQDLEGWQLPEYECKGMLWVFMGHSGSSIMMNRLELEYDVHVPGYEPLFHYEKETEYCEKGCEKVREDVTSYFEYGRQHNKYVTFKLRPWSILKNEKFYKDLVKEYQLCVVENFRINRIESVITEHLEKAFATSQFDDRRRTSRKAIIPKDILEYGAELQELAHNYGNVIEKGENPEEDDVYAAVQLLSSGKTLPVAYEDYLYNPDRTIEIIADRMNIKPKEEKSISSEEYYKASPPGLCNLIENYQTFLGVISNKPYLRWMLYDPINNCTNVDKNSW